MVNSTVINCKMPAVTIPETFENWSYRVVSTENLPGNIFLEVNQITDQSSEIQVHRNLSITEGAQALDFYLEVVLDGARYFKNLIDVHELQEHAKLLFFSTMYTSFTNRYTKVNVTYRPFSGADLHIEVRYDDKLYRTKEKKKK